MTADYKALRTADAALSPLPSEQAAAALEALEDSVPRSFLWRDARAIAQRAGRWGYIVARARQTPALPPETAQDRAVLAAISAREMEADQRIDAGDPTEWGPFTAAISFLVAVGDLTSECAAEITALGTGTVKRRVSWGFSWPLSYTDIDKARAEA